MYCVLRKNHFVLDEIVIETQLKVCDNIFWFLGQFHNTVRRLYCLRFLNELRKFGRSTFELMQFFTVTTQTHLKKSGQTGFGIE